MNAKKIAVTGGLSSGKSTVCQLFKELGAYVVSADEIVHRLLTPESSLGRQVIHLFGTDILTNGQMDRSKIAKKAFSNPELLKALEHLIHPIVRHEIKNEYLHYRTKFPLFVAEIPLLFESGADADYDDDNSATVAVIAKVEKCKQRYEKKNPANSEDYYQRAGRQLSAEEKAARAKYVIDNNCSLEELKVAVKELYTLILSS
jgi:dephospho-CoA kinase